jgi:hypothetical protein
VGTNSKPEIDFPILFDLGFGVEGVVQLKEGLHRFGLSSLFLIVQIVLVVSSRLTKQQEKRMSFGRMQVSRGVRG